MARKPTKPLVVENSQFDESAVAEIELETSQQSDRQLAVMERYGDGLPYNREHIIAGIVRDGAIAADHMLSIGKGLLILKECEPHGDYQYIVENRLEMSLSTARKMAQAAAKYLSPQLASKRSTFIALGSSKLFELMTEDDDDLIQLADGGSVAGMELDEIERMSVRELKKALRDTKADLQAKDQRMADLSQQLGESAADAQALKRLPPDDRMLRMRNEISAIVNDIDTQLRTTLASAVTDYVIYCRETDIDPDDWGPFINQSCVLIEDAYRAIWLSSGVEVDPEMPTEAAWRVRTLIQEGDE